MKPGKVQSDDNTGFRTPVATIVAGAASVILGISIVQPVLEKMTQYARTEPSPGFLELVTLTVSESSDHLMLILAGAFVVVAGPTVFRIVVGVFRTVIGAAQSSVDSIVGRITARKDYPVTTVQARARWVESERADEVTCLTCDLSDPGYRRRFGRETVVFGHVVSRREEGSNPECVTCRQADPIERSLRAERDDPVSMVDQLDLEPAEAHDAVEEVGAA